MPKKNTPLKNQMPKHDPKGKFPISPNPRTFVPVNNFRLTHPNIKRIGHQVSAQLPRYRKAG